MKNKYKLYIYHTFWWLVSLYAVFIIISIFLIAIYPKEAWLLLIFPILPCAYIFFDYYKKGFFYPINITDKSVQYKTEIYNWSQIRITAYPWLTRSYQYGYYLIFGTKYFIGDDIKKELKRGFHVYLNIKYLRVILKFYEDKIVVLDVDKKNYDKIKSTKKINKLINNKNLSNKKNNM